MVYFETECEAHKDLQKKMSTTITETAIVWFESATGKIGVSKVPESAV
jgi:hypothetical protein